MVCKAQLQSGLFGRLATGREDLARQLDNFSVKDTKVYVWTQDTEKPCDQKRGGSWCLGVWGLQVFLLSGTESPVEHCRQLHRLMPQQFVSSSAEFVRDLKEPRTRRIEPSWSCRLRTSPL